MVDGYRFGLLCRPVARSKTRARKDDGRKRCGDAPRWPSDSCGPFDRGGVAVLASPCF